VPLEEVPGTTVKANLLNAPATVKLPDVAPETPLADADKEKVPCVPRLILQPANVATPLDAFSGLLEQVSDPDPELTASVTDRELPVTVLPLASSMVTTGCVVNVVLPVLAPGLVVNTR
jgi:hypothetical protein